LSDTRREAEPFHRMVIPAEQPAYAFSADAPARWRLEPHVPFEIQCSDGVLGKIAHETDVLTEIDLDHVNPVTGPIWIKGAEPGDTIVVVLEDITVPQDWGYMLLVPGFGLLGHRITTSQTTIVSIDRGAVIFAGTRIPIRPCIGTIGVAPEGKAQATMLPGDHGGNIDTSDICAGSRLYLRVNVPGALMALGDGKASMGDGEVSGTGVGVPIDVRGHIELLKGRSWPRPILETASEWQVIASEVTLEAACCLATADMVQIVMAAKGWSWEKAYMFLSIAGSLRICQVVDPLMTVRMVLSKQYLPHLP
jgi:amidase